MQPINLSNSEMFCKILLIRGLFLHAYYVPHNSWFNQTKSLFGVKKSLLSLSQFSRVCPPMIWIVLHFWNMRNDVDSGSSTLAAWFSQLPWRTLDLVRICSWTLLRASILQLDRDENNRILCSAPTELTYACQRPVMTAQGLCILIIKTQFSRRLKTIHSLVTVPVE